MSETFSELHATAESEPEPSGHWRYVHRVLEVSKRLDVNSGRYGEWISESGDSRIAAQPKRIRARMSGEAFKNYTSLTVSDKHDLEDVTQDVMYALNDSDDDLDMRVLINYVPLLFTNGENAIIGRREHDSTSIMFESDKLRTPRRREILIGGLATVLYYVDFPKELRAVE